MSRSDGTVMLEDVKIVLRNFSGREGQYNAAGEREFSVLLDADLAHAMAEDGWNVKWFKVTDQYTEPQAYITVKVFFGVRPPRINMITSRGRTPIHESEVDLLDDVDIETVDLVIRPHNWTIGTKSGKKAYLQKMFITIVEDHLDQKYNKLDDLPTRNGRVE